MRVKINKITTWLFEKKLTRKKVEGSNQCN